MQGERLPYGERVRGERDESREKAAFRLIWLVFFFQGMSPGFWMPALTNLFGRMGIAAWVPAAFIVPPLCALLAPLVGGALADQRIPAERVYAWSSLFSGVLLASAFGCLDAGLHPGWFIGFLAAQALAGGPSWGLLAVISMSGLKNGEKKFPLVRMGGTVGWMAGSMLTSYLLGADTSVAAGYAGAVAKIFNGIVGFHMPHTPPLGASKTWRGRWGLDAFRLFRERDHRVIFLTTCFFSIPITSFYMYSPELLKYLGDATPAGTMAWAQIAEIIGMLTVGALMGRFRLKTLLMTGLLMSVLRFGMSAVAGETGVALWHIAGISLHGLCYTYYFITVQVYLDQRVDPAMRGQAQGLLSLMYGGAGPLLGAAICGWLRNHLVAPDGTGWGNFWWVIAGSVCLCAIYFGIFYRGRFGRSET